ncbi:DoxX family protein [Amycolatopsis sp. WQ 127309]|uniref:DoxX family protein n=1 Tax=Amycolatopsis sp. WQ 127309 TaxID=2932773 RepID=UPI001FF51A59|nr:DoxX family protein [Amycolatopsis sp. WQ 127309]UOZ02759.1 DoxX family protein [Amycolatopsis sp. WQ 127309]
MNVALWIIAGLLALAFLAAGAMKLLQPKEKLAAAGMAWTEDYSGGSVKGIGAIEIVGAIGLILPALLVIVPILTPIAATGLAITMLAAIVVHVRRKENQALAAPVVLLILSAVLAWGRFGPYAIS